MRKMTWGMGVVAVSFGLLLTPVAHASESLRAKAIRKVHVAAEVLKEIMHTPDKGIPRDLLKNAAGVAIFPNVIKAGFIFGGKYGQGVIIKHDPGSDRWSAPAFYSIGAGSVGWQIGAQSTDLVLIIRHQRGVRSLLKDKFTLGADASVAAGPVGRKAEASTDLRMRSEVLAYSRSRGLFAGISLEGAKLNPLHKYDQAYYGRRLNSEDILFKHEVSPPASSRMLIGELERDSRPLYEHEHRPMHERDHRTSHEREHRHR